MAPDPGKRFSCISQTEEIACFFAFRQKILESIGIRQVKLFKNNFFAYLYKHQQGLVEQLDDKGELTEEIKLILDKVIKDFFSVVRKNELCSHCEAP